MICSESRLWIFNPTPSLPAMSYRQPPKCHPAETAEGAALPLHTCHPPHWLPEQHHLPPGELSHHQQHRLRRCRGIHLQHHQQEPQLPSPVYLAQRQRFCRYVMMSVFTTTLPLTSRLLLPAWPECRLPSALASCSNSSFSLVRGASVTWRCQLTAPPSASLHLRLNHTAILLASQPRPSCGKDPQVTFHIQETPSHVCYSNFTVVVVICSANESVVGDFRVMRGSGAVANGTLVVVKLAPQPTVEGKSGEPCRLAPLVAVLTAVLLCVPRPEVE